MRHGDVILTLQWRHGSTCDQRADDVRLFLFYRSLGLVRVCEINRIHHWCSVGTEKSQPEGPPFQWETRLAEFPTERWTRGLGFFWNHWTPMIDSFSHIPRPYGTVLCNICWWRHWGRCLQSMTRAVQLETSNKHGIKPWTNGYFIKMDLQELAYQPQ